MSENMSILGNTDESGEDNLNRFWTSFTSWYEQSEIVDEYFKIKYVECDNNWFGRTLYYLNIDYEQEYKIYYGISYPLCDVDNKKINFDDMQDFIEIMYDRWIKSEKHYDFTIEINKKFEKFYLPYRLNSGKICSKGYRTTETIGIILNQRMFERKIAFSEQMIMSSDMLDKKCALDYVVDALQYYISIQNAQEIEKKYAQAAITVNPEQDTKVYAVVKSEIKEVMKLSNEYFDIRHNEYLNKAKQKREALDDLQFIEYLYNRVYSLLYLLRLKAKREKLITEKN